MGRAASLTLCWETRDMQGDARLLWEKAGVLGRGCLAGVGKSELPTLMEGSGVHGEEGAGVQHAHKRT